MKIDNQKEIWNRISEPWKTFRVKPLGEVVEFLKDKKGNILDLGCGSGRNFVKLNREYKIYGVDFSENQLKFAKEYAKKEGIKAELVKAEAFNLPFESDFFDAAIFINALHCIPEKENREKTLKELLRVMKPETEAIIMVWNKEQERFRNSEKDIIIPWKWKGKEYPRYYYLYDEKEFANLLKKTGFEVLKVGNVEKSEGNSRKNIIAVVRKPEKIKEK